MPRPGRSAPSLMKPSTLGWILGIAGLVSAVCAAEPKGAERMVLFGGKSGEVPFPHAAHQTALPDCNACHGLFPQAEGAIESLKSQGRLEKKQVMNQCQVCHRQAAKAGKKSGPTGCKACHSGKG